MQYIYTDTACVIIIMTSRVYVCMRACIRSVKIICICIVMLASVRQHEIVKMLKLREAISAIIMLLYHLTMFLSQNA